MSTGNLFVFHSSNQPIACLLNLAMPLHASNQPLAKHIIRSANQITIVFINALIQALWQGDHFFPISQSHILH